MDHYFISGDEELEIVVEVLESFGRALKVIQLIFFFLFFILELFDQWQHDHSNWTSFLFPFVYFTNKLLLN